MEKMWTEFNETARLCFFILILNFRIDLNFEFFLKNQHNFSASFNLNQLKTSILILPVLEDQWKVANVVRTEQSLRSQHSSYLLEDHRFASFLFWLGRPELPPRWDVLFGELCNHPNDFSNLLINQIWILPGNNYIKNEKILLELCELLIFILQWLLSRMILWCFFNVLRLNWHEIKRRFATL